MNKLSSNLLINLMKIETKGAKELLGSNMNNLVPSNFLRSICPQKRILGHIRPIVRVLFDRTGRYIITVIKKLFFKLCL